MPRSNSIIDCAILTFFGLAFAAFAACQHGRTDDTPTPIQVCRPGLNGGRACAIVHGGQKYTVINGPR